MSSTISTAPNNGVDHTSRDPNYYTPLPITNELQETTEISSTNNGTNTSSHHSNHHMFNSQRNGNGNFGGLGGTGRRDPNTTNAYLIGGGIASLAAAVHLIQDAKVPAAQVHIFESLPVFGGAMDGAGDTSEGYILRGGRMLNFSYVCLYDLLDHIPSLAHSGKTVTEEIKDFNSQKAHQTHAKARLIVATGNGPEVIDVSRMGLNNEDRIELIRMTAESEKALGTKSIQDCFPKSFFETNFWYMWATM
jgi:myosin-crossreactive antigen